MTQAAIDFDAMNQNQEKNLLASLCMTDGLSADDSPKMLTDWINQYEKHLLSMFEQALEKYELVERHVVIKNPSSEWKVSSCMQKAIRRGNVEVALRMGNALLQHDEEYLYRRLPIIAMEDVNLGNPLAVAWVFCISGKKQYRAKLGAKKVLYFLLEQLAGGIKDRSVTELYCTPELGPQWTQLKSMMAMWTPDTWADCLLDPSEPMMKRAIAARYLAGTKRWSSDGFMAVEGDIDRFLKVALQLQLPPLVMYLTVKGSRKGVDGLFILEPLAYDLMLHGQAQEGQMVLTDSPLVNGVLACAYDVHTQDGKRAYAYYAKACDEAREWFDARPDLNRVGVIGAAMFVVESGLLDRFMWFDEYGDMMEQSHLAEVMHSGVAKEDVPSLLKMLLRTLPEMHHARHRVTSPK